MNEQYKNELVKVKSLVEDFEINLYTSVVNLFMQGEMLDWSSEVPIGEKHTFDNSLLESSNDENIKQLLSLHSQIVDIIIKMG